MQKDGQVERWTCRQANMRTCGQVDMRTCGHVDRWTCRQQGQVYRWTVEHVTCNMWTDGHVGMWEGGQVDE